MSKLTSILSIDQEYIRERCEAHSFLELMFSPLHISFKLEVFRNALVFRGSWHLLQSPELVSRMKYGAMLYNLLIKFESTGFCFSYHLEGQFHIFSQRLGSLMKPTSYKSQASECIERGNTC